MTERPRRCLVTGASGFIGGHVARRVSEARWEVRCLVRPTSDTSGLSGLELVFGDLTSGESLARAAAGCDGVVHCAALVSDWATVGEITRVNVDGTRAVVGAAADAGVSRFVHVSTTDVYGYRGAATIDEDHVPGRFANWYAQTKLAAEGEVGRVAAAAGLPTVILRPATVYGPGSTEVVGEIARALRNGSMLLIDRGRHVAGLCYVDNLVDAVMLALTHDSAAGHTFNVADGSDVTWRRLTDDLACGLGCRPARWSLPYPVAHALAHGLEGGYRVLRRATGLTTAPLLSRQAVHVLGTDQRFSNRRLRERLGWEPRVGYAAGLEATLGWLRAL